jgi:hypothetical protein
VVDLDAALGEQLLDIAVGQVEAQIPADRKDDDLGREAEAGKAGRTTGAGRGRRRAFMPALSLLRRGSRGCNSAPEVLEGRSMSASRSR